MGGGGGEGAGAQEESCLLCTHELIPLWDFTYLV